MPTRSARTPRHRLAVLVCLGLATAGTFTACASPPPADTVRVGLSSAPTCADPRQASTNQTVSVTRQVADSLLDQDPRTGDLTGWLAQTWDSSPDGRAVTFHLRTDATFSDGTPVTADVVRANFDDLSRMSGSTALLASGFLRGYRGTDVVDAHTARVRFATPNAQFLQATTTTQLGILGAATLARPVADRCDGSAVVGSGPFVYGSWAQGRSVRLLRRDGYRWGSPVTPPGASAAARIDYTVIPESGVRSGSVAGGDLDLATDSQPEDKEILTAAGGRTVSRVNPGLPYVLQPNLAHPVPGDLAVRRAVSQALDRNQLVETLLGSDFRPATGPLASTTPDAQALVSPRPDVGAAAAELDAAGWRAGRDGIRERGGTPLRFDVLFSPEFVGTQAILELAQQQLRRVGIGLNIVKLTNAEFLSRRNAGDFDFVYYNVTRGDPDILRARLGLDDANYSRRQPDSSIDPLLTAQLAETEPGRRRRIVASVQRDITDKALVIPVVELSQVVSVGRANEGVAFDASAVLRMSGVHNVT